MGKLGKTLGTFLGLLFGILGICCASSAVAQELSVRGKVLHDGHPLIHAEIDLIVQPRASEYAEWHLTGNTEDLSVNQASTNSKGEFTITAPEAGRYQLIVRHPRYLSASFYLDPLFENQELPALNLPKQVEQDILVVDALGEPIPNLNVHARGWSKFWREARRDGWWPRIQTVITDDQGRVRVAGHVGEEVSIAAVRNAAFLHHNFEPGSEPLTVSMEPMRQAKVIDADGRSATGVLGAIRWPFLGFGKVDKKGKLLMPWRDQEPLSVRFVHGGILFESVDIQGPDKGSTKDIRVRLPRTAPVQGTVLDAINRAPIPGAYLWVPKRELLQTEKGGAFAWTLPINASQVSFRAVAPGYLEREVQIRQARVEQGKPVEVILYPERKLAGQVVDIHGDPVVGASLYIELDWRLSQGRMSRQHAQEREPQKTDRQGRFELSKLSHQSSYRLTVGQPGFASKSVEIPALEDDSITAALEDPQDGTVRIVLEPGLRAFGQVLDALERPLAQAEVMIIRSEVTPRSSTFRNPIEAKTDAEGRFLIDQGTPGRFLLSVWKKGYSEVRVPGVELFEGQETDLGTVYLEKARTLHGTVVDREGQPIEKALIQGHIVGHRMLMQQKRNQLETETLPDGTFRLEGLSRASQLFLYVSHPEFQTTTWQSAETEEPLIFVLDRSVELKGRVLDGQREGVEGAQIVLSQKSGNRMSTRTGSEGHFRFTTVPPGEVTLVARGPAGISEPLDLNLTPQKPSTEIEIVLEPGARLSGHLRAPDQNPVSDGRIGLKKTSSSTQQNHTFDHKMPVLNALSEGDGYFSLAGMGAGTYTVRAEHPDYAPLETSVELRIGQEAYLDLTFEQSLDQENLKITGRVLAAGEAVGSARIMLTATTASSHRDFVQSLTQIDGGFELIAPQQGEYKIQVEHPDYATLIETLQVIAEPISDLVFNLSQGATVEGTLHGLEFDALADLQISAFRTEGGSRASGSARYDGTYSVRNLTVGKWVIMAQLMSPYRGIRESIEVDSLSEVIKLDLHFDQGFELQGVVLRNGSPLTRGQIHLSCSGKNAFSGASPLNSGGEFKVRGVPEGPCRVSLFEPSGTRISRDVVVTGDDRIRIEYNTTSFDGRVLSNESFSPIPQALVKLVGVSSDLAGIEIAENSREDGGFRFTDIPAGEWRAVVNASGYEYLEQSLNIQAPSSQQFLLRPSGPAVLFVTTPQGKAPESVRIEIWRENMQVRSEFHRPKPDGRIELSSPPAGQYTLRLQTHQGYTGETALEVPGTPMRIVLEEPNIDQ